MYQIVPCGSCIYESRKQTVDQNKSVYNFTKLRGLDLSSFFTFLYVHTQKINTAKCAMTWIRSHHFTESWIRCWHQLQQLNHVIYFVVILSAFTHNSLYCLLGIWKVRKPKKRFQIWEKCSYSLKNERGPNKAFPRCFLLVKLKLVWSNIIFFACTQNQIFRFRLYQDIICTVS